MPIGTAPGPDGHDAGAARPPRDPASVRRAWRGRPRGPALGPAGPARPAGRRPPSSTSGAWARRAGPTPSTPPRSRPGTKSWKAFFFGSSDAANFITVDKPPASLWVMELSARIFGLNSWSILVPQALEGVAIGGRALRRRAALVPPRRRAPGRPGARHHPGGGAHVPVRQPRRAAGAALTVAAYATVRALERASTWWLVLAMAAVGTGFITKMLQAFLVVPALALVYLVAAPTPLRRRIAQLLAAAPWPSWCRRAGGWRSCQLTPAADRPYIGGSQDNNLLNLIFGYNGLGRLSGNESGSVGGAGAAGSRWGPTGLLRFFGVGVRHPDLLAHPRRADPGCRVAVVVAPARRAPTRPAPPCSCGGARWSSPCW